MGRRSLSAPPPETATGGAPQPASRRRRSGRQKRLALYPVTRYNPQLNSTSRGIAMFRDEKEILNDLKSKLAELRGYL